MQKIIPNLWFDKNAEEAVDFYASIFKGSKIHSVMRYGKSGAEVSGQPEGSVMTISFELLGQKFVAINGGPEFKFSEAISFMIECKDQDEIDYYWKKLSEDGDPDAQQCGWLKDKFGLSWQVVPEGMDEMIATGEPEKAERAMQAMLQMKKIDIKTLEDAYNSTE